MSLIEMSEAQELLSPYVDQLYSWPTQAWDIYHRSTPRELLVEYSARTRASAVHDLMVARARADEMLELKVFNHRKMKGVLIAGRLVARFKKLSEDGKSCSIPTKQVRDFRQQRSLPGFPSTHNVELGYVLNEAQTDIVEVLVTQPSGKGVAWAISITSSGMQAGISDIFSAPKTPNNGSEGAVIKIKDTVHIATVLPFKKGES
jgi:hypothetical protein